ncbi:MAG: hypothetical protein Q4F11_03935, partial [Eubacteriales bacterium]|nr:hypothetical protein [Eubacteriales bacterium]
KDIYKILSKYIDEKYIDYDAFASGDQIFVIVNDNPYGNYDDTLKAGDVVNYHYTKLPTYRGLCTVFENAYPYTDAFTKLGMGSIVDQTAYEDKKDNPNGNMVPTSFSIGHRIEYSSDGITITDRTQQDKFLDDMTYRELFEPCVAPVAAGVVYLDDSLKDELKDIVVNYGYYTVIASDELAKRACERQNEFMAAALKMDVSELGDNIKCTYSPNQMQVRYTLTSAVSSTSNIIEAYCRNIGITYASNTEEKVIYRSRTINAFLQYGITLIAVFVVAILLSAILAKSRCERRKSEYKQMLRLGADQGLIIRMCMLEALREAVWCIPLLPFLLLIQLVIYLKMMRKF